VICYFVVEYLSYSKVALRIMICLVQNLGQKNNLKEVYHKYDTIKSENYRQKNLYYH